MGNARKTVLRLLTRLENSGSYSNILLDEGLERSDLSPQDKKFAAALFYGVLERQITLDNIIREYSRNPKNKLGTEVRVILRMGLYQLLYMDSVPDNAAVDESVKLAKKNRNPAASGFVNAMLREFIRNDKKLPKGRNATEELSIEYSAPVWLTEKWTREYGKDICLEMLKTSVGQAPVTARVNTVFHSLESTLDMLAEEGITFERLSVLPDCIRICGAGAVEHTKAYKEGRIHVQDLSSQLCCAALDPKENDTVLDLCAAPGGKTTQLGARLGGTGLLVANDISAGRAKTLLKNVELAGIRNAIVMSETPERIAERLPNFFDKILVDAPCSGEGMFRKEPDMVKSWDADMLAFCRSEQAKILEACAPMLKAGGMLLYSTCTFSPEENEKSIGDFLERHPEFELMPIAKKNGFAEGLAPYTDCARLYPHRLKGEGHFLALLRKKEAAEGKAIPAESGGWG